MAIEFATDAWIKALMSAVNQSAAYKDAARNWEGDFYFVVDVGEGIAEERFLYIDLWHGEARDAYAVAHAAAKTPAFELRAPIKVWKGVLEKKIDPIRGIMTRQLKLRGNMMQVMKAPKAAIELVNCAQQVDTSWPG